MDVGRAVAAASHRQRRRPPGEGLLVLEQVLLMGLGHVGRHHLEDLPPQDPKPPGLEVRRLRDQVRLGLGHHLGVEVVRQVVEGPGDHVCLGLGHPAVGQRLLQQPPPASERLGQPAGRQATARCQRGSRGPTTRSPTGRRGRAPRRRRPPAPAASGHAAGSRSGPAGSARPLVARRQRTSGRRRPPGRAHYGSPRRTSAPGARGVARETVMHRCSQSRRQYTPFAQTPVESATEAKPVDGKWPTRPADYQRAWTASRK